MNRDSRMKWAGETVEICQAGFYIARGGKRVEIKTAANNAVEGTVLYSPENAPQTKQIKQNGQISIEVANETTFSALKRLAGQGGHLGCLNFASAKNPGGGFLTGAQAQEEALARSSALYPCLLQAPQYYERNRANRSTIYLDLLIYSPLVPFFRDDEGVLLEHPVLASVITAPAPNAGAVMQNEPQNSPAIEPALRRRAELVLKVAHAHGIDSLVLGAWGCGVFRNDPRMVAGVFFEFFKEGGRFATAFSKIIFAVFDRTEGQRTFNAFLEVFGNVTP